jgi:hypothetical protein
LIRPTPLSLSELEKMLVSKWLSPIVVALLIYLDLTASSAVAQTCFKNGNGFTSDNGVAARRSGGLTVFSNGSSAYSNGNTTSYSSGITAERNGSTTTFSNGITGYTNGNKTTYSNGLTCYQYGSTTRCD